MVHLRLDISTTQALYPTPVVNFSRLTLSRDQIGLFVVSRLRCGCRAWKKKLSDGTVERIAKTRESER